MVPTGEEAQEGMEEAQ
jgi:hypothetical protein